MATFTVHEPPPRKNETAAPPERYAFVRDGFYFWAFLLGPVWMLYHRLWLVFIGYILFMAGLGVVLAMLGTSIVVKLAVGVLIAVLIGFEAGTLRRWSLRRWINHGIVIGDTREAAEYRFFAHWSDRTASAAPSAPPPAPPPSPMHVPTSDSDIIGLFPEPQARR